VYDMAKSCGGRYSDGSCIELPFSWKLRTYTDILTIDYSFWKKTSSPLQKRGEWRLKTSICTDRILVL
jgi:hypothetical protein